MPTSDGGQSTSFTFAIVLPRAAPQWGRGPSRGEGRQLGFGGGEVVGGRGMRRLLNIVANGQLLSGRPGPKVADPLLRAGTCPPLTPRYWRTETLAWRHGWATGPGWGRWGGVMKKAPLQEQEQAS